MGDTFEPTLRLAPLLLLLLACLLVATSCADTPAGPRLRGARAAIEFDQADWIPPPPCPPLDDSVFPPDLQAPSTVEAGTIDGSFSVSPSGEAAYSIPLAVPPGRAGMQPALSVSYDSAAGDGPLGVGFSVAGLSAISRCPKNMADDGEIAAVQDAFGDPLCLDGLRLNRIAMLAPQPALVREYLFSYTAGAATGRALLDQIQECAADGACKPPTRFLWHTGGSPGFMTLPTTIQAPQSPRGSLMTLDMTGDGLDDLVLTDVDMTGGSENFSALEN
jgi:hypothetical protein